MSAGWFVVNSEGKTVIGPFREREEAVSRLWRFLRVATYRNPRPSPLFIWHGDPLAFAPVSAFYPSMDAVPPAVWEVQRTGHMVVVRLDDGTCEALA